MEKGYEYKIELNELFIDFRQAFDTVYRSKMIETLNINFKTNGNPKQIDQTNQDYSEKHTSSI